jgi:hypothetical protein
MELNIKDLKEQLSKFRKQSDSILDRLLHILSRGGQVEEGNDGAVTFEDVLDSISANNSEEIERLYLEFNAISMTLDSYRKGWDKRMELLANRDKISKMTFDTYDLLVLKDVDKNLYEFRKFMNSVHEKAENFMIVE